MKIQEFHNLLIYKREIKNKFADERRTKIDMTAIEYIEDESLIPEEDVIITITNKNYIKRMTTDQLLYLLLILQYAVANHVYLFDMEVL